MNDHRLLFKQSFSADSDQGMIAALQAGRQGLGPFYEKYAPVLLGLITKCLDNRQLAEKVFERSFVKVCHQIGDYDPAKGSLTCWMLSVSRKIALEACKSAGNQPPLKYGAGEKKEEAADKARIEGPPTFTGSGNQTVFDLIFWKGLSCAEAAAALGIPEESVKTTFRVAIKELRAGSRA